METALNHASPRVLAIVVSYNAMRWADRCLGSLLRSSLRPDVLVVDNGSADGTREHVASAFPEVRLICNPDNAGFGAANNIGLRIALDEGYDFVYLMNQDAWVEEDTLSLLVRAHSLAYGVLSPVQNDAAGRMDSRFEHKCGRFLKRAAAAPGETARVVELPFVMAAHWLVSREALLATGGFSPAFRQYGEDDNFIDRLHWHGFLCGVVPSASAVHDRSGRRLPKEKKMKLKCVAPVVKLSNPGNCLPWRCVLEVLELAAMSVKNFSLYPLKQLPALLKRLPELKRLRAESRKRGAFL